MSSGAVHSQAREVLTESYAAELVVPTLAISRSSLYYRKWTRGSQADRSYDDQIVMACGEKLAYGYRRVAWWLWRNTVCDSRSHAGCWCVRGVFEHGGRKRGVEWKPVSQIRAGSLT